MSEQKLALLAEMLDLIERYAATVTRESLEADREVWLKVRGALEIAAQCAIDLAMLIVAARGLGIPQSYRQAFAELARAGIIDAPLSTELEAWAGLRNVLVHVYTSLDLDRLHAALFQTAPLRAFHAAAARELSAEAPPAT